MIPKSMSVAKNKQTKKTHKPKNKEPNAYFQWKNL